MWMKVLARSLVLVTLVGLLTASAPRVFNHDGNLPDSAVVREMVESQLAAGDGFMKRGALGSAEQAYRVAAMLDRARGATPTTALRRIANLRFFQEDYKGAARALDGLAEEAAAGGDRRAEFWASVDAAYLERLAGDREGLERSITRAQLLLDSDAFSEAERDGVTLTVTTKDLRVFAPHLGSW